MIVVGGGPAGLAAAMAASDAGADVELLEWKPSAGRKFLVAGKGGLNLTHAEPLDAFLGRYREVTGVAGTRIADYVRAFPPSALRALADSLGAETWVGSTGRVFPKEGKAAPLLRAWIARLKSRGVRVRTRVRWSGFGDSTNAGAVAITTSRARGVVDASATRADVEEPERIEAGAVILALGGASWPETGSDAAWVPILRAAGVEVADLEASNAGAEIAWPAEFAAGHEGEALKHVVLRVGGEHAAGDVVLTRHGIEGTPVYRLNAAIRAALASAAARGAPGGEDGAALTLDIKPDLAEEVIAARLARDGKSIAARMKTLRLGATAMALLRTRPRAGDAAAIARTIKAFPLRVTSLRPIAEAISSAGGVRWSEIDAHLMLKKQPGVFVAGEMIDWDAPTGGYLLQACVATGIAAGRAAAAWAAKAGRNDY